MRSKALDVAISESAFTDLTDLPSIVETHTKNKKKLLGKHNGRVSKAARFESWNGKKARAFTKCYECDKHRCIYTRTNDAYIAAMRSL